MAFQMGNCSSFTHPVGYTITAKQYLGPVHITPFSFRSELFYLPVHITPFLNKNGYLSSAVFAHVLKNGSDHLLFVFALCSLFSSFPDFVSVFVCYQRF